MIALPNEQFVLLAYDWRSLVKISDHVHTPMEVSLQVFYGGLWVIEGGRRDTEDLVVHIRSCIFHLCCCGLAKVLLHHTGELLIVS